MNTELNNFLIKLRNMHLFKRIKYNGEKYNGEISAIQNKIISKDTNAVLEIWKQKINSRKFELEHPIYTSIKTRAVYNIFNGRAANYVFMIDKENKYPWIFTQATCLIDYIIVPDYVINLASPWPCHGVDIFKDVNPLNLIYSEKQFGFTMAMIAPQHYTYFLYQFFLQMDKENMIPRDFPIDYRQCFFLSKKYIKNTTKHLFKNEIVWLYPMGIEAQYRREAEEVIYNESLRDGYLVKNDKKFDLIVWLGLSAYRTWVEQEEGIKNIFVELSKYFSNIKIYFNGVTSYDSFVSQEEQDLGIYSSSYELFQKIKKQIQEIKQDNFNCEIISLDSKDYRTKICYCDTVDICISEGNTTGLVPFQFCKKPGVNFIAPQSNGEKFGTILEQKYILKSLLDEKAYHMYWGSIFNLLVDIVYNIKKIKMSYVKIIDVELLRRQHEIKQNIGVQIPIDQVLLYDAISLNIDKAIILNEQNKKLSIVDNTQLELSFQSKYGTAQQRIQNRLCYKLGQTMIINSKNIVDILFMPIYLLSTFLNYKQDQKIYHQKIKKDPTLKLPPLENYPDYQEALKMKNYFSYRLGEALMKASKTWYKGGYIKLWFEIVKLREKFNINKIN
ncbi:TPA: hypothetical protein R8I36_000612 [Campylobacter jejuni]|nr:hypothetical protein [Campylobacter jejuni]